MFPSTSGEAAEQVREAEPQREWVALVSVAVLLGNGDERAQAMAPGTDVLLDLKEPPLPSYLQLHPRVVTDPRRDDDDEQPSAYVLAADSSGSILLRVGRDLFICRRTETRAAVLLPVPSTDFRPDLGIGLLADPHHAGDYLIAQLHPATSDDNPNRLLCYSTQKERWFRWTLLQQARVAIPSSETGVLAHDGRLWWLALAHGVFFCDPFVPVRETPQLRYIPLPDDCETMDGDGVDPRISSLIQQRRCVRPSGGKLRFVEIRGLSYDEHVHVGVPAANPTIWMWSLDNIEAPNPWTLYCKVAFAEVWDNADPKKDVPLRGEVPHVAFVDPRDHFLVYFLQGSKLFGLDMLAKKVVACVDLEIDLMTFRSSRPIVDVWELSPLPPTLIADPAPGDRDYIESMMARSGLGRRCSPWEFCTTCMSVVCLSCCPNHVVRHHGPGQGSIVRVGQASDKCLIVDARELKVNNLGYDWRLIQRRNGVRGKHIILRDAPEDKRYRSAECVQCSKKVKTKTSYCTPACKVLHKPHGRNTEIIRALVESDFGGDGSVRDRFCRTCRKSFASNHCSDHEAHFHQGAPGSAPPVPAVAVFSYHDGWSLLPEDLLEVAGEAIQRVSVDGEMFFPVCSREPAPAGQGGHPCGNEKCRETVMSPAIVCSLWCWVTVVELDLSRM